MGLTIKRELVDEIRYELYGGMPTNDAAISEQFVLRKLNDKIAESAVKSAFGNYNLDGAVVADDIFRLTYTGISVTLDSVSGYYTFQLPATPVGIPGERSFEIYPPANRGGARNTTFKMIARNEVPFIRSTPQMKKVYCFVDNGNMGLVDEWGIVQTYPSLNMSVITSGANDLTAFLNLPDDMISAVKALVLADLRPMISLQDTTPLPAMDSPEPR